MTDDEGFESAVRRRAFELSRSAETDTPAENWLRAEREHLVAHEYDTVDRDLEQLGMSLVRLPSEAGVNWRLKLPEGEQFEAWEPGTAGLAPPRQIMGLIGGITAGKALIPSAPAGSEPGGARLRKLLEQERRKLRASDPGVRLGADPKSLRKHRAAARRSRAFLRATRAYTDPDWQHSLTLALRLVGKATGPARAVDMLLGRLQAELRSVEGADREGAATLVAGLVRRRTAARRELLEALDDGRYHQLLEQLHLPPRLRAGVESIPVGRIAQRELHALAAAVSRLARHPTAAGLNELLIALERACYAAELSVPENRATGSFLAAASKLEEFLGEHRDAALAESLLRSATVVDRATAAAFVAGRVAERQAAGRAAVRAHLPAAWRRLRRRGSRS